MTPPAAPHLAPAPRPARRIRVVTAAALFDGHDAAIHIMRRLLQAKGAEVIHLGHDRSVEDVAEAAIQEDADAVAVSSYQGGHVEFFTYLVDRLRERGAGHVRVYGGGGGTIVPEEIAQLHAYGVARIFSPEDGRTLGLDGMIQSILDDCAARPEMPLGDAPERLAPREPLAVARTISWFEEHAPERPAEAEALRRKLDDRRSGPAAPVVGITGTGGAGKSSVVDELVRRWRLDHPDETVGLLLVDPTRRRSGGALLGDRIRMNAIHGEGAYARSLATRTAHLALSATVADAVRVLQASGFDLILVETAGIGQSDSEIVDLADVSIYVMTPDYGAPSQLEKIDMLDLAHIVVLNKSDRRGAQDALRDVRKQWRRNRGGEAGTPDAALPVFPTIARAWNDPGVDALYAALLARLGEEPGRAARPDAAGTLPLELVPGPRARYLAEIAETVRGWRRDTETQAERASDAWGLERAAARLASAPEAARSAVVAERDRALGDLEPSLRAELVGWDELAARYRAAEQELEVRGRRQSVANYRESLSGSAIPKVALPRDADWGARARFLRLENLPGRFPFTAGVFPFKRDDEDPTRMFAGEGGPERTNRRFHLLTEGQKAARLSTAFDSVTLYGRDPGERPDVYGKVGTSGVSVCTVDDAKKLYSGFDLCAPGTSVSMTINGPAPILLAFFLNAAIDQAVETELREKGELDAVRARFAAAGALPDYDGELPGTHSGLGLGLLGIPGDRAIDPERYARIRADVLQRVRGTVQADILKEDQAQNTCIYSTEFSLKLMGDVQEWFIANAVRNFYSVSISGYHMAEAGANPISQLAFTLANGFTYCEYYLSRGMAVDEFAPNFSFFFSNGLDPEYAVIGRVARRIWAIAMRERYGASERSQKLKYHVQTSGRSLHAREMSFNDIRTTLQALLALQDHCNSLHTNAYDEAVTTPTPESVRRAVAIQLIIQRELGTAKNENPLQGSHLIEELTDLVEEAVLREFERISERGGVLGAMETLYQRSRIQEESLLYESRKHSGELPIVGVNTFLSDTPDEGLRPSGLMRASDAEKAAQLASLRAFHARHAGEVEPALRRLADVARSGGNVFAELMDTVKVASLGQISEALFEVGGRYRRAL
jgi:isobutyryl-CoA mutase